ncbi:MAG TPA: organic hydroperoxide resistance protein [Bacillales bacterium]|nr:organic hydroperoxide resistance protein [Bacillales bacterium]
MGQVVFTAHATAKGGRNGHVKSDDGVIDVNLVMPPGQSGKQGSNPEQLFAATYSACYDGALNLVASNNGKDIESTTTADVSFVKNGAADFNIAVVLNVEVKGVNQDEAEKLTEEAHQICPYSKAIRGNVDVEIKTKAV